MLCYLGRDLFRWIGQCSEIVERTPELIARGVREQSFAKMLIRSSPPQMIQKLCEWGVADHAAIFARAMGLNMVFREIPAPDILHDGFLQNYHHYADYLFNCYLRLKTYAEIDPDEFRFEMYASGEYARMLEEQWGGV